MRRALAPVLLLALAGPAAGQADRRATAVLAPLEGLYPELEKLYKDLHQNPELSLQEENTSAKMAERLGKLGFEVTGRVGGWGVVGVLKNGAGPRLLVRADMDALPVEEKTGLPYASKAVGKDDAGRPVPVMHACGHDIHMSSWLGAATLLSRAKDRWRGTLVVIAQPAEEKGGGAQAMLKDGLYTRFGKPDFAIAFHDSGEAPAGSISYTPGYAFANVDSVDVTIHGKGGHGAMPHLAVDPIVIASRAVVSLQTLVSRENSPLDPAVVTVGSIHAGTKHNIIPETVKLQLTVRSYRDDVRRKLLEGIARIVKAEAAASGAPREPEVTVVESTPSTYNDPKLSQRVAGALRRHFGEANVEERLPTMGGEDFSEYGRAGVPAFIFWVGATDPRLWQEAQTAGRTVPSIHSSQFAPAPERTIKSAASALTVAALELLGKP